MVIKYYSLKTFIFLGKNIFKKDLLNKILLFNKYKKMKKYI